MRPFAPEPGGYVAALDTVERQVLGALVADVVQLLGGDVHDTASDTARSGLAAHVDAVLDRTAPPAVASPPQDPAVLRLLPDASRGDAELAGEFRRLTEDDLRRTKVRRLVDLWRSLRAPDEELHVPRAEGGAFAATLTDVRLVLAERLDLTDDDAVDALYDELDLGGAGEKTEGSPEESRAESTAESAAESAEGAEDAADTGLDAAARDARAVLRQYLGSVYVLLTFLQESLLTVMLDELSDDAPSGRG